MRPAHDTWEGERNSQSQAMRSQDLHGIILEQYVQLSGEGNDKKDDTGNDEVFKEFRKKPHTGSL